MLIRVPFLLILVLSFIVPRSVRAGDGDLGLLTSSVPPFVILLFDNSGSMNHHLWDDDFDPNTTYAAQCFGTWATGAAWFTWSCTGDSCSKSKCGQTITIYHDKSNPENTRYDMNYVNWLLGTATPAMLADEPQQTRLQAAKQTVIDLIDNVNPDKGVGNYIDHVIFGLAQFDSDNVDPDGGFVSFPPVVGNKTSLKSQISGMRANTWTPLSETLVDLGRYFAGENLLGTYPQYNKNSTTGNTGQVQDSPIDVFCRRAFVVLMTDGEPTMDLNDHHGSAFMDAIGNADGDSSECAALSTACTDAPGSGRDDGRTYSSSGSDWLDDVALYLKDTDLHPNLSGKQNVVTYTLGFTIDHPLLSETAKNGTGLYFTTNTAEGLADKLAEALRDIIKRSTSFAAATVPTSRTSFGDGFFAASFVPDADDPFWAGHLQAYRLGPDLSILSRPGVGGDPHGVPAVDPETGSFLEPRSSYYFWDAAEQLKNQATRTLYTTKLNGSTEERKNFDTTEITASDLGVVATDLPIYPNYPTISFATTEALADGLVNYLVGKDVFDEDDDANVAETRAIVLGDIFHSSSIAVGRPPNFLATEPGYGPRDDYNSFMHHYQYRDRKLYVGANDGMLHAFHAGQFNPGDNPGTPQDEEYFGYYDLGLESGNGGQEAFGYVPGILLDKIKKMPVNIPRSEYYVDGNPSVADVWMPTDYSDPNKEWPEWRTVLMTGMREGGDGYLVLDITNPSDPNYPELIFELDPNDGIPLGETWSEAILTRIKILGTNNSGDNCGANDGDGNCREQWVAIFSGGYREDGDPNLLNYVSDPNSALWSANSKGIFIVALGGPDHGQLIGKVVYDSTDDTHTKKDMKYSIPSTPAALDLDFDGFADVIYVGDLGGQLWKWDISEVGAQDPTTRLANNWPAGRIFVPSTNSSNYPVDIGSSFHYYSIFYPPAASFIKGELVLAFASGERTDLNYEGASQGNSLIGADDDNNRFWVVWDRTPTGAGAFPTTPIQEGISVDGSGVKHGLNDITGDETDDEQGDDGYFFRVPDGEKFIVNHLIFRGFLLTLSYVPDTSESNICNDVGYTNVWLWHLRDATGEFEFDLQGNSNDDQRRARLGNGAPTDPRITISKNDDGTTNVKLIGQTSLGEVYIEEIFGDINPVTMVYWRQMF